MLNIVALEIIRIWHSTVARETERNRRNGSLETSGGGVKAVFGMGDFDLVQELLKSKFKFNDFPNNDG